MTATKAKNLLQACVGAEIPRPSAVMSSGRGLYVLWFLADANGSPVHADWKTRELYGRVQAQFFEQLKLFGADPNALSVTQVLRVPGTLHGKTRKPARIIDLEPRYYTLEKLAAWFGMPLKRKKAKKLRKGRASSIKRRAGLVGKKALNEKRSSDLLALEKLRGGFTRGYRRKAIRYYLQFLLGAGHDPAEASNRGFDMARRCQPKYYMDDREEGVEKLLDVILERRRPYRYSNQKIVTDLRITNNECLQANLQTILTPELTALKEAEKIQRKHTKEMKRDRQLQIMGNRLAANPRASCKQLMNTCARRGCPLSRRTFYRLKAEAKAKNGSMTANGIHV